VTPGSGMSGPHRRRALGIDSQIDPEEGGERKSQTDAHHAGRPAQAVESRAEHGAPDHPAGEIGGEIDAAGSPRSVLAARLTKPVAVAWAKKVPASHNQKAGLAQRDRRISVAYGGRHFPRFASRPVHAGCFNTVRSIGSFRRRLPVAAKIALVTAGTMAEVPASPMPPGGAELWTM
jgi:hypothetical protein